MDKLIEEVTAYAKAKGASPSTVIQHGGKCNGTAWASWINGTGDCTLRIATKIRKYMEDNPA